MHQDTPATIIKREGPVVTFDRSKVEITLTKCFRAIGRAEPWPVQDVAERACRIAVGRDGQQTTVERMQDAVEAALMAAGEYDAARSYILYREQRAQARSEFIPQDVREAFAEAHQYFGTPLQEFQFYDKYSRYDWERGRRETWVETVDRAVAFLHELSQARWLTRGGAPSLFNELRDGILTMQAMPSMRLLALAGPAARRNNAGIYNCSAVGVSCLEAFKEALLISMEGCGLGYSVESHYIRQLPFIKHQTGSKAPTFQVEDTAEGWGACVLHSLQTWFDGGDLDHDLSLIRPAGSVLKTKGGRASGPEPLRRLLQELRRIVLSRQGMSLRAIDAHDIMCNLGDAAIMGGFRRMALLALYDHGDREMRKAKSGANYPQVRWNANNSEVWPEQGPSDLDLILQMGAMFRDQTGEPGIFNRGAMTAPRRKKSRFLVNPCGEIFLRDMEFCNLSQVICRPGDGLATLKAKVRLATILGTIQSLATHFPGLRPEWAKNCEEERLLGVDLNGQMDCEAARDPEVLRALRGHAIDVNRYFAEALGIGPSAAITCQKPNGNSSTLLHCGPGGHGWLIKQGIRRVEISEHSPIFKLLRDQKVPMEPKIGKEGMWLILFPYKAPDGVILRRDLSAVQQLERWMTTKLNWTEHNPSVSIGYGPDEMIEILTWLGAHRGTVGGITFYPHDDAAYDQPPYQETTPEEYERARAAFPPIDFSRLWRYEHSDMTTAAQERACVAGACLI